MKTVVATCGSHVVAFSYPDLNSPCCQEPIVKVKPYTSRLLKCWKCRKTYRFVKGVLRTCQ